MIDETERWKKVNYWLSLSLYTLLVEMERCVGHCDACYKAVEQIVLHGRSLDDKVPSSLLVQIDAVGSEGKAVRVIREATELLRQLGERFPQNPGKVAIAGSEFTKTKIMLRGRSDEDLASLPFIVSEMNVVMELLAMICSFAFHAGMTFNGRVSDDETITETWTILSFCIRCLWRLERGSRASNWLHGGIPGS